MRYHLISSILLFSIIFLVQPTFCQVQLIKSIEKIKLLDSDKKKIELYHDLLKQVGENSNTAQQAELYRNLGLSYSDIDVDKAIAFMKKGIDTRQRISPKDSKILNEYRYELAQLYKGLRKSDEQYELLGDIIAEGLSDSLTCVAHADQAVNRVKRGDNLTAVQILNSALADNTLMHNIQNELIIRFKTFFIYAKLYEDNFDADRDSRDLEILEKHQAAVEKKFNSSGLPIMDFYKMYNNLGIVYEAFGKKGTALNYYEKAIEHYRERKDTLRELYALTNIGLIYGEQKNYKKAKECFEELIKKSSDKEQIATGYINMGYYLETDSSKSKIPFYFKAFNSILDQEIVKNDSLELPTLEQIIASTYQQDFLIYLVDLAAILVQSYQESNDQFYLVRAKETLYLIDQLVSIIRYESLSEQSKLFWIEKGVDTYMLGVKVCHLLKRPDEAFYFMEKNKALLLQENIKTLQAKLEMDILEETLEKEYSLYYRRVDLYEKFLQRPDNAQIKRSYTQINKEYNVFMDSLDRKYSGYSKTKKQIQIVSLDEAARKYVSNDKCFVEYILNDNDGYGIFCSSEGKKLFRISDVTALQSELSTLNKYWTKPILSKSEMSVFQNMTHSVFQKLFPFKDALNSFSGKQVTIIADQNLNHLPFEALSVSVDDELVDSYLINFCNISYLQSISVSEQISQKENNPKFSLLGLAPFEFQFDGLSTLSKSKESIEELSRYQGSKILMEGDATKKNFLEEIDDYNIIHLNTHAGIDSFNLEPWIAFRDEKMSLNELYGKENQAELVVLDACKTNDGKLALGEGILNLSRGFFYNGTQSVLASNWNVNEKSGNDIIKKFYVGLEDGKTKSHALQLAKIDYLKEHQFSEVLPYYWAAYTITGDISPVELSTSNHNLFYMGLVVIAFFLFSFLYYRFKS